MWRIASPMRWLFFIILLVSIDAFAGSIDIGKLDEKTAVSKDFEVIEDAAPGQRVDITRNANGWHQIEPGRRTFKFGITEKAYWVRTSLINPTNEAKSFY